ncbi:cyclic nucleotide-binding domain-containing protein 2-like isoform X2 [Babylonia areolata]|uniref:cyclic nucleotide-binding domain-containing protein 2-like isoform X2 n=1 Tax=Babylonia areolata TaxID=304850 RepID=UPI003FD1F68D
MTLERCGGGGSGPLEPAGDQSRQSQMRREKFLQRVIEHIQESRVSRVSHAFRHTTRHNNDSDPRKSVSSETDRSQNGRESCKVDGAGKPSSPFHKKRSSTLFSPNNFHHLHHHHHHHPTTWPPTRLSAEDNNDDDSNDDNEGHGLWASVRHGGRRQPHFLNPPRIRIRAPSLDTTLNSSNPDLHPLRDPLAQSFTSHHHHQSLLSGSGSGFTRPPRPPSPMVSPQSRGSSVVGDLFSWQICTPTNWKRGKTERQILLERKKLRRRASRQGSQSTFISIFKVKDPHKLSAADRIRRVLRRAHFYGDDIKRLPLVRFRRAVRTLIALLKTVKLSRDKGKGTEPSTWIDEDDIRASRKAYGMFGITFDVYSFRARREIQVSNEAKAILSMAPGTRSDEQRHVALVSLSQAVPEFGEFPIAMQEALVRVGWYENFEARRIIIREGHMADNFYLILSGSAVVTIREQNGAGDYFGRTVAVLQRGNSFGELALIYGGTRSATVTCKDNVELLAVGRDDYIDIFMHRSKDGGEPEHLKFLKQIKVFCGWPIHSLPLDDPSIFLYTYVRRGMVLCKDSNQSEWIYVIKSGSCRVLTALHAVKPSIPAGPERLDHCREAAAGHWPVNKSREDRHPSPRASPRLLPLRPREGRSPDLCPSHTLSRACKLPAITSRSDQEVRESNVKHEQELDEIMNKRYQTQPTIVTELFHDNDSPRCQPSKPKQKMKSDRIFVNLQTLQAKDVYGLESVVLSVFKEPTRTSLVSDGAECIMISKKFFQQKLSEEVAKDIRKEIRPLPSEEVLQEKLQTKTDWDTFRAITVADFVDFRKQLNRLHAV